MPKNEKFLRSSQIKIISCQIAQTEMQQCRETSLTSFHTLSTSMHVDSTAVRKKKKQLSKPD